MPRPTSILKRFRTLPVFGLASIALLLSTGGPAAAGPDLSGSGSAGRAVVQLGLKVPTLNKGKIKLPLVCQPTALDLCAGRILGFTGGENPVARGTFALPHGRWSATLYPKQKLLRQLKKRDRVLVRFEVKTRQSSGTITRSYRRAVHRG